MTRIGDISSEAMRRALARLQGTGAYSDDPGSLRNAELSGVAEAFAAAASKVNEAFSEAFPGIASVRLNEWETFLQLGNAVGRTDSARRDRLENTRSREHGRTHDGQHSRRDHDGIVIAHWRAY